MSAALPSSCKWPKTFGADEFWSHSAPQLGLLRSASGPKSNWRLLKPTSMLQVLAGSVPPVYQRPVKSVGSSVRPLRSPSHPIHPCSYLIWADHSGHRVNGKTPYKVSGQPVLGNFLGQGSFARHAVVDESCLIPVDQSLPMETLIQLSPVGCGIITGFGSVVNGVS